MTLNLVDHSGNGGTVDRRVLTLVKEGPLSSGVEHPSVVPAEPTGMIDDEHIFEVVIHDFGDSEFGVRDQFSVDRGGVASGLTENQVLGVRRGNPTRAAGGHGEGDR